MILGRQLVTLLIKVKEKKNSLDLQNTQAIQQRMEYNFYWKKNLSTDWTGEVFLSWFSLPSFFNQFVPLLSSSPYGSCNL